MILDTTDNSNSPISVSEAVAKVLFSQFSLQVSPEDAAFICGIYAHMEITKRPSLEEEELEVIFAAVSEAALKGDQSVTQRSVMAVQRMRKQGLLERADARGLAGSGVYTLSSLATKLRHEIFERETLTRRSLRVMMKRVIADLSTIKRGAEEGGDAAFWAENVVDQLRHLVQEVIRSIARRQKGLESEQMDIRRKIVELIQTDGWQESKKICDELLQTTSATLEELHKMLMEEMGAAQNLLLEIGQAAQMHDQREAWEMADRLREQVDAIRSWSDNFQATWQEYYKKTHEHMRFNLRVDPNRKLSQRLRQSIKDFPDQPWHLCSLKVDRIRFLREDEVAPITRASHKVTVKPQREADNVAEQRETLRETMIAAAKEALAKDGALQLSVFLQPYLPTLSNEDLFMITGTLQAWLMQHANPNPKRESNWIVLHGDMEIQDVRAVAMTHAGQQEVKTK